MWQNPNQNPNSYFNLRARLRQKMQKDGMVKEKIQALLVNAYEQALNDSQVVLSRPERKRLFSQLVEEFLTELINENKESHG
jgi:hypothetical protein